MEDDTIRKNGNDCLSLADFKGSGRELLQVYFYPELESYCV
jgi:hypothetical protein